MKVAERKIRNSSTFRAASVIGDYWSTRIVREALLGADAYSEFAKRIDITNQTLSARLRSLVQCGCLEKFSPDSQKFGTQRYRLTPMGKDLYAVLFAIKRWQVVSGSAETFASLPEDLVHKKCCSNDNVVVACSCCGEEIHHIDILSEQGPGAGYELPLGGAPQRQALIRSPLKGDSSLVPVGIEGDRWAILIMACVFWGDSKFEEFQEDLLIPRHTLTTRLRRLVEEGLLARVRYQAAPVRYAYQVTAKGVLFYPVILALAAYGDKWLDVGRGKPVYLKHQPCGSVTDPQLRCKKCNAVVEPDDITSALHCQKSA